MITVRILPSALHKDPIETAQISYHSDWSIAQYKPDLIGEDYYVLWNGKAVKDNALEIIHPSNGDELIFCQMQGFSAAVAALVELGISELVATIIVSTVISTGLSFALQKLIGTPGAPTEDDPNHTFGALENTTLPGTAIPINYGEIRFPGHFLNLFTRVDEQGDSKLFALIGLGEGRIESLDQNTGGLLGEFDDLKNDDASISGIQVNGNTIADYDGVTVSFRAGELDQSPIKGFKEVVNQVVVAAELGEPVDALNNDIAQGAGSWLSKTTSGPADALEITVGFPEGLIWSTSKGKRKTFHANYQVRYRTTAGPGEWQWVDYDPVTKTWVIKPDSAITYQSDPGQDDYATNNGRNDARPVHVERRSSAVFETLFRLEVTNDTYEVQIRRLNVNTRNIAIWPLVTLIYENNVQFSHHPPTGFNRMVWDAFAGVVDDELSYPGTAIVAIKAIATDKLQGGRPNFTCPIKGLRVPVWDGTNPEDPVFPKKFSQNPAWHMLDVVVNDRYGLGRELTAADIDLDSLKTLADYSDELVTDGVSGNEARFEHDRSFADQPNAWDMLLEITKTCRTGLVQRGRQIAFRTEQARARAARYSRSEIIAGSYSTNWLELDKPNQLVVQYLDRSLDYSQESVIAETVELNQGTDPLRTTSVLMAGVVRQSQAIREATFMLNLMDKVTKAGEATISLRGFDREAADRIGLENDASASTVSGRCLAGSTLNTVILDKEVILEAAKTYSVEITHKDGTTEDGVLSSPAGTYKAGVALSVTNPWLIAPDAEIPYGFGEQNLVWKDWIITSISRESDKTRRVELIEYDASVYVDGSIVVVTDPTDDLPDPDKIPPDVTDLLVLERVAVEADGSLTLSLEASWRYPKETIQPRATVYFRDVVDLFWTKAGVTGLDEFQVAGDIELGVQIEVAVCATTLAGSHKDPGSCPSRIVLITGRPNPPTGPTSLVVARNNELLRLSWDVPDDNLEDAIDPIPNLSQFRAWRGSDFRIAPVIGATTNGRVMNVQDWYPGRECYIVKAIDTTQQSSNGSAIACSDQVAPSGTNLIVDRDEKALGWPGSKLNLTQENIGLLLSATQNDGVYTTQTVDLGAVKDVLISFSAALAQRELAGFFNMWAMGISAVIGTIAYGTTVTGVTSGATGKLLREVKQGSFELVFEPIAGTFVAGETVGDGTGTAVVLNAPRDLPLDDPARADRDFGGLVAVDKLSRLDIFGNELSRTSFSISIADDLQVGFDRQFPGFYSIQAKCRYILANLTLDTSDTTNYGVGLYDLRLKVHEFV